MNIGFFGDSYVDLNIDFHARLNRPHSEEMNRYKESLIWAFRLCNDLEYTPCMSGLGGSSQFYAVKSWQDFVAAGGKADYAIFTFTWEHRIYAKGNQHHVLRGMNQNAQEIKDSLPFKADEVGWDIDELILAAQLYNKFLFDQEQANFVHELTLKWILELPEQYPDTKFIFLPNTEMSRKIALKYFKKGILLDFAFEQISLLEGEHVGVDPLFKTKFGHMTNVNHDRFKDLIKNIILSYNTHEDKVYPVDYEQFRID